MGGNMNSGGREGKFDLTSGSILSKLLVVALPTIGTQFIMLSYNLVDMFLLGRVGSEAVAASGSAGMFIWLSNGLMMIGRMGAEIGVAQCFGRGAKGPARRFSQNSLTLAALLGVAYGSICILFSRQLIGFFNIREASVAAQAASYLAIIGIGTPFNFIAAAVAGTFNGSGNARVPFMINSLGLVLNAVLDPIFIFTLGFGVNGAAIATVLAMMTVCALSLLALTRRPDRPFFNYPFFSRPNRGTVLQILRWSMPICVESVMFTLLTMFISRFTAAFGANAIAVYRIGTQIESLSWLIGGGVATGITAFVGQNFGASRWDRIHGCWRISLIGATAWGGFVTALLFFAGGLLFRLFLPDPVIVSMGISYLKILALCQVPMAFEAVSTGNFRGIGNTLPPSIVTSVCNALRVPLAWYLSQQIGIEGIWWGISIGATARGLWLLPWFLKRLRTLPKG